MTNLCKWVFLVFRVVVTLSDRMSPSVTSTQDGGLPVCSPRSLWRAGPTCSHPTGPQCCSQPFLGDQSPPFPSCSLVSLHQAPGKKGMSQGAAVWPLDQLAPGNSPMTTCHLLVLMNRFGGVRKDFFLRNFCKLEVNGPKARPDSEWSLYFRPGSLSGFSNHCVY